MELLIKKTLKKIGLWKQVIKARNLYYKISKRKINRIFADGSVSLPRKATMEITVKCNLNCKMCPQKAERKLGRSDYSLDGFCKILNNLGPTVKYLSFIGGEIFVHPDIFSMLKECQKRNIKVHLSTNATLLDKDKIDKLKRLKDTVKGIGVSIDGLPETHNAIRGSKLAFNKSAQALRILAQDFNVSVNTVLFKENLDELLEVVKIFKKLRVQNFSWQFEVFASPQEILASAKMLGIDLDKLCVEEKIETQYDYEYHKIERLIKRVRKIKGISFVIQPRLYDKYSQSYFSGNLRSEAKLKCKDIFACRVDSRGNVIFCPAIKAELGNLIEKPINEIWNNNDFKAIRLKLLRSNLTPICKRCCRIGLK